MGQSTPTYHGDIYQFSDVKLDRERNKSLVIAYLLWFLFGGLGMHRFYMGRINSGLAQLGLTVLCLPALFISLFLGGAMLICLSAWLLLDAVLIPFME